MIWGVAHALPRGPASDRGAARKRRDAGAGARAPDREALVRIGNGGGHDTEARMRQRRGIDRGADKTEGSRIRLRGG